MNGAVQAGSSLGSDLLHSASGMAQTPVMDAVVTGGLHSAIQWVRGDRDAWMQNYAASAASQFIAGSVADMAMLGSGNSPAIAPSGSAMEQVATLEPVSA